ncbi:MAG: hypothetical protein Q7Q71_15500 [Verrucomicrobiota bacterium JB023]|nr:hypothetical protein [Verrucomicrobiota bacterium JB023]
MADVDALFGDEDVRLAALSDAAGVLRAKERKQVRLAMNEFERRFPQLFFAIYVGAFEEVSHLRQFGFWLLNRGAFVDVEVSRPNEYGVLLTIDVAGKAAGLTYGYSLAPFLDEDVTFTALTMGHPFLIQGQYLRAIEAVMKRLERTLKSRSRKAARSPEKYEAAQPDENAGQMLERIRSKHQHKARRI